MTELTDAELEDLRKMEQKDPLSAKQLMKDTDVYITDMDEEMRRQSGLFSHYAEKTARAQQRMDNMKMKRDVVIAKIDKEVRDEAAENGGKVDGIKLTEKVVEGIIHRDKRWVKAQMSYNNAKAVFELNKGALEALKQKRDMLIQLGVNAREEMKGEMRMQVIEANESAKKSARERAVEIAGQKQAESA